MQRDKLRKKILLMRDDLSSRMRMKLSGAIRDILLNLREIKAAQSIFSYVNFRSEVETLRFIRTALKNKDISVPLTLLEKSDLLPVRIMSIDTDLQPGYCNIPEPVSELCINYVTDLKNIDVIIVPGVVFDRKGGRLGYGGGYYDRFLAKKEVRALRIGLAFEIQLIDKVPLEIHDELMDMIITDKQVYDVRK